MNESPIRAELVRTNCFTRWACHVCGGHTEKVGVLCEVPKSHPTHAGFRVCERCLEAGNIDARMLERADELEAQAEDLRDTAGRLRVPSFAEWQRTEDLIDAIFPDVSPAEALAWPVEKQLEYIAKDKARRAVDTGEVLF